MIIWLEMKPLRKGLQKWLREGVMERERERERGATEMGREGCT